jgi:hypothetical protein
MADRPLIQLSTDALAERAQEASAEDLDVIIHELGFRDRQRAKVLKRTLETRRAALGAKPPAPPAGRSTARAAVAPAAPAAPARPNPLTPDAPPAAISAVVRGQGRRLAAGDHPEDRASSTHVGGSRPGPAVEGSADGPSQDPAIDSPDAQGGHISPYRGTIPRGAPPVPLPDPNPFARLLEALRAEIEAIKDRGKAQGVQVTHGRRLEAQNDHVLYAFRCENLREFLPDTGVLLHCRAGGIEGSVVSVDGDQVIIALDEDSGPHIGQALLQIDTSFMVKRLLERFEAIGKKEVGPGQWNKAFPGALLSGSEMPVWKPFAKPPTTPSSMAGLNDGQRAAVQAALRQVVTEINGPPGTGKSRTVATLIECLISGDRRILVTATTNRAVDELLRKTLQSMIQTNAEMVRNGGVIRHGVSLDADRPMAHYIGGSAAEWPDTVAHYVVPDRIADRLSRDLAAKRTQLEQDRDRIMTTLERARTVIDAAARMGAIDQELVQQDQFVRSMTERRTVAAQEVSTLPGILTEARARLDEAQERGVLESLIHRILGGTSATTLEEIVTDLDRRIQAARRDLAEGPAAIEAARSRINALQGERVRVASHLTLMPIEEAERAVAACEAALKPILASLAQIRAQLENIRAQVLTASRCQFATNSHTYLKPKDFPATFDVVILEEASMIVLPAAVYAAGLATTQLIVTGDPQQLPPVVQVARDHASRAWMETDLFAVLCHRGHEDCRLTEQHRMRPEICGLITDVFYEGRLTTSAGWVSVPSFRAPKSLKTPYQIVDTTALVPFTQEKANTKSRYNVVHAHVIRDLVRSYLADGVNPQHIYVLSPYRSQVELLTKVIAESGPDGQLVKVGTVHSAQGGEAPIVIYDTTESAGAAYVGPALKEVDPSGNAGRSLNVALSRAQEHVVVVASLGYLEAKLPRNAILRHPLHTIFTKGGVVPATEVFTWPKAPPPPLRSFDPEGGPMLFGDDLWRQIHRDIRSATASVIILSAYLTQAGSGRWAEVFRSAIQRGVRIRIITKPPKEQGSIDPTEVLDAVRNLEALGVVVDFIARIHGKAILIDGTVFFHGSCNIMSWDPTPSPRRTREHMHRAISPTLATIDNVYGAYRIGRLTSAADYVARQVPLCTCGHHRILKDGFQGQYLTCTKPTCPIKVNVSDLKAGREAPDQEAPPSQPPPCPVCAKAMVWRRSTRGHFWGCSGYPACQGTRNRSGTATTKEQTPPRRRTETEAAQKLAQRTPLDDV